MCLSGSQQRAKSVHVSSSSGWTLAPNFVPPALADCRKYSSSVSQPLYLELAQVSRGNVTPNAEVFFLGFCLFLNLCPFSVLCWLCYAFKWKYLYHRTCPHYIVCYYWNQNVSVFLTFDFRFFVLHSLYCLKEWIFWNLCIFLFLFVCLFVFSTAK